MNSFSPLSAQIAKRRMASGFGLRNTPSRMFKHVEFIHVTHIKSVVQFGDTGGKKPAYIHKKIHMCTFLTLTISSSVIDNMITWWTAHPHFYLVYYCCSLCKLLSIQALLANLCFFSLVCVCLCFICDCVCLFTLYLKPEIKLTTELF